MQGHLRQDELTQKALLRQFSCSHRRKPTDPDHCVDVPEDLCRIRILRSGLTKKQAEAWEQLLYLLVRTQKRGFASGSCVLAALLDPLATNYDC